MASAGRGFDAHILRNLRRLSRQSFISAITRWVTRPGASLFREYALHFNPGTGVHSLNFLAMADDHHTPRAI